MSVHQLMVQLQPQRLSNAVTMDKLPSALSFTGKTISNMTLPVGTDIETLVINVKSNNSTTVTDSTWTHLNNFNNEILDNQNAWDNVEHLPFLLEWVECISQCYIVSFGLAISAMTQLKLSDVV